MIDVWRSLLFTWDGEQCTKMWAIVYGERSLGSVGTQAGSRLCLTMSSASFECPVSFLLHLGDLQVILFFSHW